MKMQEYLNEIEFAVTSILWAVWHEYDKIESINNEINELSLADGIRNGIIPPGSKINHVMITGKLPKVFLSLEEELLFRKGEERKILERGIFARRFAIAALSGALLQIARQGISVVHQGLNKCPDGRMIGHQPLKVIIWQGRNHSLHWEERKPSVPVHKCFHRLFGDFGMNFATYSSENLAFKIVNQFGWRTFNDFKSDMLTLQ